MKYWAGALIIMAALFMADASPALAGGGEEMLLAGWRQNAREALKGGAAAGVTCLRWKTYCAKYQNKKDYCKKWRHPCAQYVTYRGRRYCKKQGKSYCIMWKYRRTCVQQKRYCAVRR